MGIAFGLLRLSPHVFWSMTPIELTAALEAVGVSRSSPPGRDELARLMHLFPDGKKQEREHG